MASSFIITKTLTLQQTGKCNKCIADQDRVDRERQQDVLKRRFVDILKTMFGKTPYHAYAGDFKYMCAVVSKKTSRL